jgi:polyketide synthase PksN
MAGSLGNLGQADYSTANGFMDAYARYRNVLVDSSQRQGRTLSIAWPLWQEGGMHIDEKSEKRMMENTGMISMQTSTGIQALYQSVSSAKNQVMIIEGNVLQLRQVFGLELRGFTDEFYLDLSEKISKGELSEEQLVEILRVS